MLIKNLLLKFKEEKQGQLIFVTDNGLTLSLPGDIFPADFDRQREFYLAIDEVPLLSSIENKKQLLNELLNPDDK